MTLFDQQTGQIVTGAPVNITAFSFELVDENGHYLGRFPLDNWPKEETREVTIKQEVKL